MKSICIEAGKRRAAAGCAVREFRVAAEKIVKDAGLAALEKRVLLEAEFDRVRAQKSGRAADLRPLERALETWKRKAGQVRLELLSTLECRAHNLVPRRLSEEQEVGEGGLPARLWELLDGRRDFLACIRIMDRETSSRTAPAEIRRYLDALKMLERHGRVRLRPACTVTLREIEAAFRRLGIGRGMNLVVHSSFSALGHVKCAPESVCRLLMKLVGKEGTLLMPAFTFGLYEGDDFGQPFDIRSTPSCCGILTETFRKMPGVLRSCEPCHSFSAWGRRAAEFVRDHHKVPTVSKASPLGLLEAADGWCLAIAAADSVTFMHVVESSFGAPCLGTRTEEFPAILADGRKVKLRTWGWRAETCPDCPSNRTGEIFAMLRKRGALHETVLGGAALCLFRLSDYRRVYEALLRRARCRSRDARPRVCAATVASDWDEKRFRLKKSDAFTGDLPEFAGKKPTGLWG